MLRIYPDVLVKLYVEAEEVDARSGPNDVAARVRRRLRGRSPAEKEEFDDIVRGAARAIRDSEEVRDFVVIVRRSHRARRCAASPTWSSAVPIRPTPGRRQPSCWAPISSTGCAASSATADQSAAVESRSVTSWANPRSPTAAPTEPNDGSARA